MTLTPEQIMAANKANLETLVGLTSKAFAGVEQLIDLNLQAVKTAMTDSQHASDALLSVRDAQELLAVQAKLFQPLADKAMAYNRELMAIASHTGNNVGGMLEGQLNQAQSAVQNMVDTMAKNAPAGSEPAVKAIQTAVATGTQAMQSVQKAVQQASDMVQSNLQQMADSVSHAAPKAARSASKKR